MYGFIGPPCIFYDDIMIMSKH